MHDLQKRTALSTILLAAVALFYVLPLNAGNEGNTHLGYYRYPAIHGDTIIFTAEGDLWSVSAKGGAARRLTSNPGKEIYPAISPDGKTVAFSAEYEGPLDVYTMPVEGGLPQRRTWDGKAVVAGWTPDGRVLVRTATILDSARSATRRHRQQWATRNRSSGAVCGRRVYAGRENTFFYALQPAVQSDQTLSGRHGGKYLAL